MKNGFDLRSAECFSCRLLYSKIIYSEYVITSLWVNLIGLTTNSQGSLNKSHISIIMYQATPCRFDPFIKKIPCYTIRRLCEQDATVNVNDAATVHIFNCTAYKKVKNENLRSFLKFVQTNKAESDFTRRLDDMVKTQKKIEELKQTYLSWSLHDRDVRHEGMKEGIAIGEERAKLEAARNMLADNMPESTVAKYTDLPLETVQKLADELKVPAIQ